MALNKCLLKALEYPRSEGFDENNVEEFRTLVVWLENMKIRFYKPDERKSLSNLKHPAWTDHFQKYLTLMDCPLPFNPNHPGEMVSWLLRLAIGYEYQDNSQTYNAFGDELASKFDQKKPREPFPDVGHAEVADGLARLCKALNLNVESDSVIEKAKAVGDCVESQITPALAYANKSGFNASDFPLGFSTGDQAVDEAATLLRMLYIKDLRELQTTIDRRIVEAQEYTANPKTDSKLGRVGR